MKKLKNFFILLITAIFLLFLLTGCSKKSSSSTPSSTAGATGLPNAENYGELVSFGEVGDKSQTEIPQQVKPGVYTPINYDEVVGVWISYIELSGILTGKSEEQFRQSFAAITDDCAGMGINTVYVHLRPFGDALYNSDYYPWSKYVTGKLAKEPAFDPLEVMLEEAHARQISFHGWINPMRIQSAADIAVVPQNYCIGEWYGDETKRGDYINEYNSIWYLNPAHEEVVALIAGGAAEIVRKYDVDGIHIDDYFYPTTMLSFDERAFAESDFTEIEKFRVFHCGNMVKSIYSAIKIGNPNVLFGVSPQGSVSHNLDTLYADVETWCGDKGYVDYIAPQLYYGFDNSALPFEMCMSEWRKLTDNSSVKLLCGLAVYKVGAEDVWAGDGSQEWLTEKEILRRQIEAAKQSSAYGGVIFYSYSYLFDPVHINDAILEEIEAFKPIL